MSKYANESKEKKPVDSDYSINCFFNTRSYSYTLSVQGDGYQSLGDNDC